MTDIFLQIAVVIIFIVGPFWLISKMDKKGSFLQRKDASYVQIRNMLRDILIPLGFTENENVAVVTSATYKRDTFLIELIIDYRDREKEYFFAASSGVQDPIRPPRQVSMIFTSTEYNAEKRNAISTALQQWLTTE